jgi:hypothetical protein
MLFMGDGVKHWIEPRTGKEYMEKVQEINST